MKDAKRTAENLRRLRGSATQLQMSFELPVARSTIGTYERGEQPVPPDISRTVITKRDDAKYAIDFAHEYTGGAWSPYLDGPAFDGHHSSVKDKTHEELLEALEAIRNACLNKNPEYLTNFERQAIEKSLDEACDANTALNIYIATICRVYKISWTKVWLKHKAKLLSKGFLKLMRGATT